MKNWVFYGTLALPLVAFGLCGYILWRWGSNTVYAIVLLLDVPVLLGIILRLWRANKAWFRRSTPIPREDPLYHRTLDLAVKMGVPQHNLYVADPALMAKRRVVGAVNVGVRRHAIMLSEFFLKELTQDEQDAIIAHELAHTKMGHGLRRAKASLSYYLAGWNLFICSSFPNSQASNLPDSWVGSIGGAGLVLLLAGITIVRTSFALDSQTEADEIAVKVLGTGDALISGMKKLIESPEIRSDPKKYRRAHQSLYDRLVRIQTLSRSLAAQSHSRQET